jgi:hypothetical protein
MTTQTTDRWANPGDWEEWKALFVTEHDRHGKPFGETCDPEDYKDFFEDDKGPHETIEEAFNDGCN